jgi:hypothetical protein
VLPPYVDDVVCEGAAGRAVVVEARDTAVDVEGGCVEEASLSLLAWLPRRKASKIVAYSHERLERRPVEGLALVRRHITRHDDWTFFSCGEFESAVGWRGGEALGGVRKKRRGAENGPATR